ncbi:ATP synthase subunit delta [Candidatus Photodesmus blepharus]|uniref:ATP synthase subunit delta n=1 Tax=Candidatus Photodesmus blepharonis TaxID=1179155 RepID=A0A084CNN7_9GAMM|nr:F0F1 ATP synthase subunit delta [Candidatus Photodesmus blepharus]KEY91416.1 ATP synthase subunit delta [Candidatus Photodesmus blepharus]
MSNFNTIARPYYRAAFDFALSNEKLDEWSEMLLFVMKISNRREVKDLIACSLPIPPLSLAEILISICGDRLDVHSCNLIRIIAKNGRLKILPDICEGFLNLKKKYEGKIDVDVLSAVKFSKNQHKDISNKLSRRFNCKVQLNCSVDKTLIAGIVIRAGDLVIDNSASGYLRRMSDILQS